jgi:hypothetical protein
MILKRSKKAAIISTKNVQNCPNYKIPDPNIDPRLV